MPVCQDLLGLQAAVPVRPILEREMGVIDLIARRAASILRVRPCGLCSDFDGTLSRIVPSANQARIEPSIRDVLESLTGQIDVIAIITGRSIDDVRRRVGLDGLVYIGNHGLERWEDGVYQVDPDALDWVPRIQKIAEELASQSSSPAVEVELKALSLSVHFRRTDDPAAVEQQLLGALEPLAKQHGLRLTRGRMVIELRPPIDRNKGTALADLIERRGLRAVVFLGDDRTDVDAMQMLASLRAAGRIEAMSIGVRSDEAPSELVEVADALVDGVEGVAALLAHLRRVL